MTEEWKPVAENDKYAVSSHGRVYSICHTHPKLLKSHITRSGYVVVGISTDGVKKNRKVHRLVAEAFIKNPKKLPVVNHIDGNKQNNNVLNLEWVTQQQNAQHAYDTHLEKRGSEHSKSKLTSEEACRLKVAFLYGESSTELSKKFGINSNGVVAIAVGRSYKDETAGIPNYKLDLNKRKSILLAERKLRLWGVKQNRSGLWHATLTVFGNKILDDIFYSEEEAYEAREKAFVPFKKSIIQDVEIETLKKIGVRGDYQDAKSV